MHLPREVVRLGAGCGGLPGFVGEVVAADVHHAAVMAVTEQQLGAKPEEPSRGQAVIFQDNALGFVLKKPGYGRRRPPAAAQVFVPKLRVHFAGPVHAGRDQGAGFGATGGIGGVAGAGAIGGYVKAGGAGLAHSGQHAPRGLRAVEHNEQDGRGPLSGG